MSSRSQYTARTEVETADDTDATAEIGYDTDSDVLYVDLSGRLDRDAVQRAADEAVAAADRLGDGFDVITDLRGFAPPAPEAAEPIGEAQAELVGMGLDEVVRVTDEDTSAVVVNAFERRSRKAGYSGDTAPDLRTAERRLGVSN